MPQSSNWRTRSLFLSFYDWIVYLIVTDWYIIFPSTLLLLLDGSVNIVIILPKLDGISVNINSWNVSSSLSDTYLVLEGRKVTFEKVLVEQEITRVIFL